MRQMQQDTCNRTINVTIAIWKWKKNVTNKIWQMKCDKWNKTFEMWQAKCDKWNTGCPEKTSPLIQNKKCFSPWITVWECKNLYLVKVIELRVIHLLRWSKWTKNILVINQRLMAIHRPLFSKKHFNAWSDVIFVFLNNSCILLFRNMPTF